MVTRLSPRWFRQASLIHSFPRSGQRQTEQQQMLTKDTFLSRHLTKYSSTTAQVQKSTQTAGISLMKAFMHYTWTSIPRSLVRTSFTC
ncbi:MAG: hypothetical protein E7296_04880 [Lachnospiraceae bacterium]|nr:hypothetical protein [Lachnospiraceae bacterium]